MSKKQERVSKLIAINNALNSPLTGAGANAQKCSYSKEKITAIMFEIEKILALDGVFNGNK